MLSTSIRFGSYPIKNAPQAAPICGISLIFTATVTVSPALAVTLSTDTFASCDLLSNTVTLIVCGFPLSKLNVRLYSPLSNEFK